jgi:small subunit ribosomal protein S7
MPRRGHVLKRKAPPDVKYNSDLLAKFINMVMRGGKKRTAEKIVYQALEIIEGKTKGDPIHTFDQAIKNATPSLEVKPRRVGGATYQVPVEVKEERGLSLAVRWLINSTRGRSGKSMGERLAAELLDAAQGQGATVKKRDDTHKMALANKAFAHYRW